MLEITSSVEFQMSLLLLVALAGYFIASKINQSAIIGAIILGLIIGPSALGLITYTGFVSSLAHIGAVILIFVIGLEFNLKDILNVRYGLIALAGVILPWFSGYYLSKLFGLNFTSAVIVGTALTATSIAITANVLKEMGMLKTDAAKAIIGAAVIDDILGLLALSFSSQLVAGTFSYAAIALILLKVVGFLIIGTIVGYTLVSTAVIRIDNSKSAQKYPELVFMFAMMIAFFYSVSAELIGLSAIVGAFIAGVSLKDIVVKHSKPYKEGAEYLYILFGAIFFVSLGVLADLKALTWTIFWFSILLIIVAILTKVVGCGLAARMRGMSKKDSLTVGVGMSPRGEIAMIVALIGLSQGLIGQNIYVSLVMVSIITTLVTPIFLKKLLYKDMDKGPVRLKFRFSKKNG